MSKTDALRFYGALVTLLQTFFQTKCAYAVRRPRSVGGRNASEQFQPCHVAQELLFASH